MAYSRFFIFLGAIYLFGNLLGCSDKDTFSPSAPGEALIFAYPADGSVDVPLGSKAVLTFSSAVDASAVEQPCNDSGNAIPDGNFCIVEATETAPIDLTSVTRITNNGKTIELDLASLKAGKEYRLWVKPSVAPNATNLKAGQALLSFRTRSTIPQPGVAPVVIAFNQQNPEAFVAGSGKEPAFPLMDFSALRLIFNESLAEESVVMGDSVRLVQVDDMNVETPVEANILVKRHYITVDPLNDLEANRLHRLILSDTIKDKNGEFTQAKIFSFTPNSLSVGNGPIEQRLNTNPALGEGGFPGRSRLLGGDVNRFSLLSSVLGENSISVTDGTIQAFLGDPSVYDAIPIVIRKGQQITLSGLSPINLGGGVPTDVNTGNIVGTFVSDATGYLLANPFRPSGFNPDDERAPLYVYLVFDLAIQAEDSRANGILNQTLMHIQAVGTADITQDTIALEVFRTLELDLLDGNAKINIDLVLALESKPDTVLAVNSAGPQLTATYPQDENQPGIQVQDFPIVENLLLIFDEPLDPVSAAAGVTLLDIDGGGIPVAIKTRVEGSTLIVTPDASMAENNEYELQLAGIITDTDTELPLPFGVSPSDPLGGDNTLRFTSANYATGTNADAPPLLIGLYPGVGCALANAAVDGSDAGNCADGQASDDKYQPFEYEVGRPIQGFFSTPMDTSSFMLGNDCTSGAIRLLELDPATDVCLGAIPGTMQSNLYGFKYLPAEPLKPGTKYQLVVAAGADTNCDAGEICSAKGLPLNPNPLLGHGAADAGGDNIVINFTAVTAADNTYIAILTRPFTDSNGNGFKDSTESAKNLNGDPSVFSNAVAVNVSGVSGIVQSANIVGDNNIYLSGALPLALAPTETLDLLESGFENTSGNTWCVTADDPDYQANPPADPNELCVNLSNDQQVPATIYIQTLLGTSIALDAVAQVLIPIPLSLNTGATILRVRDPFPSSNGLIGYIVNEEGEDQPQFILKLNAYLDTPDLVILGGLATADLVSKPIATWLKGPVTFLEDGRINVQLKNLSAIPVPVGIAVLGLGAGGMTLEIPKQGLVLSFATQLPNMLQLGE